MWCLAAFLDEPAEITLRLPPPLARPLAVVSDGAAGVRMLDGEQLVAEGRRATLDAIEPPVRPSFDEATAASARHVGRGMRHLLSDCLVCSPYREAAGDGLGVCPGPLDADASVNAAPFQPDASLADDGVVRHEVIWAALDCPSYPPSLWANSPELWASGRIALLGRLAAERRREVEVGERLVLVGWLLSHEGRKHHTASALLDGDGEVVAGALATWIELR